MFRESKNDDENMYDFNSSGPGASYGKPPLTAYKPPATATQRNIMTSIGGRNMIGSRAGIPGTAMNRLGGVEGRPMTSISGAGYQNTKDNNRVFDPLKIGQGHAAPLAEKSDNSPEEKAKELEKNVHTVLEASASAIYNRDYMLALEKAKETVKAEKILTKYRDTHNLSDQNNLDLTYSVTFNLANVYSYNKMYDDSIKLYETLLKNKQYPQSTKIRINMGNIYFTQKKYPLAIKMYRMAIDQIPVTGKELKCKIFRSIGNTFVKLGQYQDAIDSYESAMQAGSGPDIQTAFNLLICLYARGDKEKLKKHFVKMITIPITGVNEKDDDILNQGRDNTTFDDLDTPTPFLEQTDILKEFVSKKKEYHEEKLLQAARLIAPMIDEHDDWLSGYKWIIDELKTENETVASKVEMDLAIMYMNKGKFEEAIDVLKGFEKKEMNLKSMAAINLSFIYYLEGDYQQAEKHADLAIKTDRYNAKGLVNKGNCLYMNLEYMKAKEMYLEAVGVEADCIEAIFNLGLVNMKLNAYNEAHGAFDKLHTILPSITEALYNLGLIYEHSDDKNDIEQATKTFELLVTKLPHDAQICSKLSSLYERLEDDTSACHWQTESYRKYPVNLNVISWLGVWYVKRELYEEAIEYFECAAKVQPSEIKWKLMVASCYRRLGDLHQSMEIYKQIHEANPDNIEALQYLEAICKDIGRPHEEYSVKLDKLRRTLPGNMQAAAMTRQQQPPINNTQTSTVSQAPPQRPLPMSTGQSSRDLSQQQQQPPQRSERPGQQAQNQERSARPERGGNNNTSGNNNNNATTTNQYDSLPTTKASLAAPQNFGARSSGGPPPGSNNSMNRMSMRQQEPDDEDEFADTDVTSLLG